MAQVSEFGPEEMLTILDFSGPVVSSPTLGWVAFVLPDVNDERNILERNPGGWVHVVDLESGSAPGRGRALTSGAERSSFPVWSMSGKELLFLSESEAGIYLKIWDAETDSIRRLEPALPAAPYLEPMWTAGDQSIVVAPAIQPDISSETPRVQVWQSDQESLPGDAFFGDQRSARLWLVSARGERFRELFGSPVPLRSWDMSPNGLGFAYQAAVRPGHRREGRNHFLLRVDRPAPPTPLGVIEAWHWLPDGRGLVKREGVWHIFAGMRSNEVAWLADPPVSVGTPIFGPQPERFLTLVEDESQTDPEIEAPQPQMYSIARPYWDLYLASPEHGYVNITADLTDQVSDPIWSRDGEACYFRTTDNQTYQEAIWKYDLKTGDKVRLFGGNYSIGNLSAAAGGEIVFTRESATAPSNLWVLEPGGGQPRRLTELNPQLADISFSEPELFHFQNADGEPMAALLYPPVGLQPDEKFPVITYVYEKLTPGKNRFMPRHQLFLQQGYGVLMPNVKVKVGKTGDSFVKNIVPAVEAVRARGITNDRFALWGGSFGAYATSFVITQTNIFACAVSRATPPELFRNWASGRDRDSDNIEKGQARMGGSPFEVKDRYLSQSAFFHLDKVETPVLLLHGKQDLTILFEEGAMMFYALRRLGKKATFVAYEHGDHSLYRHSRADALDVHRRMLEWFETYLKPAPAN